MMLIGRREIDGSRPTCRSVCAPMALLGDGLAA